jgi:hypothetical protein
MSTSEQELERAFHGLESTVKAIANGTTPAPPAEQVQRVVAAAVRLYGEYTQVTGTTFAPVDAGVSSTDVVVMATALLKARDLNPFDLALWFNRVH